MSEDSVKSSQSELQESTKQEDLSSHKGERIKISNLANKSATVVLGLLLIKQLLAHKECSFYVDEEGFVVLANPGEFSLDGLPEEMAINQLLSQEWPEEEIARYLKGRDARIKL